MDDRKITELEERINKDYSHTAGIVVQKNDHILYEQYFNGCAADSYIHVYSVTKSIISLLIGMAIDKRYIQGVDQKVLDFFPEYMIKAKEKTLQKLKLKHLLSMTAPYKYDVLVPYVEYFTSDDWVKFTLDLLGGDGLLGEFRYTPLIGPDILSGVLVKATGQSVVDFAAKYLFEPMGISRKNNIVFHSQEEQLAFNQAKDISAWVTDKKGVNSGGWGLSLTIREMARIGQLYLNHGMWKGNPIVSKEWILESTKVHSPWEKQNFSYGYLWWILDEKQGACAAMGDGGNIIYFNANKNCVIAINSFFVQKAEDRLELIRKYLEPLFID